MKNLLLTVVIFTLYITLYTLPETNSYFIDRIKVENSAVETQSSLDFYRSPDSRSVGFKVSGVSDFIELKYRLYYTHGTTVQAVSGTRSLSGKDIVTEEWILLGSCSGEACVYHDTDKINLEVILKDSLGNIKSLTSSLP